MIIYDVDGVMRLRAANTDNSLIFTSVPEYVMTLSVASANWQWQLISVPSVNKNIGNVVIDVSRITPDSPRIR